MCWGSGCIGNRFIDFSLHFTETQENWKIQITLKIFKKTYKAGNLLSVYCCLIYAVVVRECHSMHREVMEKNLLQDIGLEVNSSIRVVHSLSCTVL